MKRVFIANFGRENYEWPNCLHRSTVATMNSVETHDLWVANNREAFVEKSMRVEQTARGITPTRAVASRWFNLMTIIAETSGDIWIHREKNELWWTESLPDAPTFELNDDPTWSKPRQAYVCHKPCKPWSSKSLSGSRLEWKGLHPKARDFLSTEATLQQLSPDYAEYALALVQGTDLNPWHERPVWKDKQSLRKVGPSTSFGDLQRSVFEMAQTAWRTTQAANGQEETRTVKVKDFGFRDQDELRAYLQELFTLQEGLCALTGLLLRHHSPDVDEELVCSLDRIDSNGHYEPGNLQIVCRFANRWKSDRGNTEFMRLVQLLKNSSDV
ncbi:hypothetical protein [Pseudomonas fluorescens]|uniref:Uncharacterized protein n=1 Tax=Pseudomonas fluorescens TaxID=294 RepID=A0A5E6VTS8_PSEFL|nr:hypothetical protein [Pseudomonas fluorescens]VVN21395.1 hypothetical protein PS659_04393 [Pseudomonas fluorescens]